MNDHSENPLLEQSGIPVAQVVGEDEYIPSNIMPSAPPLPPGVQTVEFGGSTNFYSQAEINKLERVQPPREYLGETPLDNAKEIPIATVVSTESATLTTDQGVPIIPAPVSRAIVQRDGNGIKSSDPILEKNIEEIMLFLNTYNSKPSVCIRICGYHHEIEYRERVIQKKNGRHETVREEHSQRIDDFEYRLDLTDFIFPFGYLYSDGLSVVDCIKKYCSSENKLKTLHVQKKIDGFDFNTLCSQLEGYCRNLGWMRDLETSVEFTSDSIRVYQDNALSRLWENSCAYFFMHITIIPCLLARAYRGDLTSCCTAHGSHRITALKSNFRLPYHPLQIFDFLRPLVWVPGWSGAQIAMGMLDTFTQYGIVAISDEARRGGRHRRRPGRRSFSSLSQQRRGGVGHHHHRRHHHF